ncbi:DUF7927 domain-containing protein [Glutamicibacter arilaitensis]|uniref:DUF7927 domain-containing protein n=1 Tax=Glutamicibacter arilaitensis TaxID=256701 RepID=UPI00167BC6E7|nr:isopeptide-forming domain-containing fimbrial protein [Glutamicibacter arilaitensis]
MLNTEVRINLNDDQPAPDDTVNENFTANFTVANAEFTQIPESCLVEGVTPQSAISDDGTELTCNFGEQVEGTALALQVPLQVKGSTGDTVTFDARVGDVNADQLVANIENPFMMDIDWTNPTAIAQSSGNQRAVQFEWTLYWGEGSDPGPDSVSYNLNAVPSAGSVTSIGNCGPFEDASPSGHPNSGITDPADQVAPFPECNITGTGANATMTLSGLDYSKTQVPSKDSGGNALPADRVAIASGKIIVNVTAANPGNVVLTSSAPEYQAPSGGVANDDPSNNTVDKTWRNPGGWVSTWDRPHTNSGGQPHDDTYRVSQGTEVLSRSYFAEAVTQSNLPANTSLILCHILDNKYTEYTGATTAVHPSAEPIPGATIQYFVGAVPGLNPNQANYNPGAVSCGDLAGSNPDAGTGWLTTEPADKSTIKAVRAVMTKGDLQGHIRALLEVTQTIKPSTPVGTDVWQFSHNFQGGTGWFPAVLPTAGGNTVAQPARYPTTNAHRDLLRVVGLTPNIRKSVDNPSLRVGEEAEFTLAYSANGGTSAPETVDDFVIVDKLPAGLTYVEGSATVDPTVTEENGAQVLTWNLDGVQTNETQELTYRATANEKAAPGERLVNSANATVQGRTSGESEASVTISQDGRTIIGKSADQNFIPNVDGNGSGEGSWTVSLRSDDPFPQSFTDLIDILPYNGDERGTDFSGNYSVEDVVLSDGGTVYYTTASVNDLSDDPADASNGAAGNIDGNTVGWTDTKPADASSITAIRVIAGELLPSAERSFQVKISTDGAEGGDTYVNRVQGRASHTELVMRISAPTIVSQYYAYDLKKYVMNSAGEWVDAQDENEAEWPQLAPTDTAKYKFVVTNTGQGDLTNIVVSDPLFGDDPVWTIEELASGDSVESEEFEFDLSGTDSEVLRNEACAVTELPADSSQEELINPCDEANVLVGGYVFSKTSDPASGSAVKIGDTITYKVQVKHTGEAPISGASITDNLEAVLDDADYNDDVQASAGEAVVEGDTLTWNGDLAKGDVVDITYTVTTKDGGDDVLTNVVTSPDDRATCVAAPDENPDCTTEHFMGGYVFSKTSDPASGSAVNLGDTITYKVQVKHTGEAPISGASITDNLEAVLDDADYNDDVQASAGEAVVEGDTLTWNGDLAKGDVVDITYTVTTKDGGDDVLTNVVTSPDDRATCVAAPDENPDCTTEHFMGGYVFSKTSDPASGSAVKIGDTITYKVQVKHTGEAPISGASITDNLEAVLDDADYNDDVQASAGEAVVEGDTLTWNGDLAKGDVVDITYTVTTKDGGDDVLTNVVTSPDDRATCVAAPDENPDCTTEHFMGGYVFSKTSDPASGSAVNLGDTITYKVQVKHTGEAPISGASITDNLEAVLDDADYNDDVQASAGEAVVEGDTLTWNGDLAKGDVVDITYTVTTKDGGDDVLTNVVTSPDDRATCVAAPDENPDCTTEHFMGGYVFSKTSDPASGSAVNLGDTITYKVQVKHTGEAPISGASITDNLEAVLDDADYNDDVQASAGEAVVEGDTLTWNGDLAKGDVVDITYTVTTKDGGDDVLTNVVTSPDDRATCVAAPDENPDCTTEHFMGGYVFSKTSDPASGSAVKIGDTITYKVQVKHTGEAPISGASITDNLEAVLDDADYNDDVQASAGEAVVEGDTLTWNGDLAKGDVVDITYTVTTKDGGDDVLTNVVTSPDDRATCVAAPDENPDCTTEHFMGGYVFSKTSDPASGSAVKIGDTITYKVQVKHTGEAPISGASITDNLEAVLDDADYNDDVQASAGEAVVEGDTLTWNGDLAKGDVVDITYTVTTKDGGDDVLTNVVTSPDDRATCVAAPDENPDCTTEHFMGGYVFSKTSDPASGSAVKIGDTITYKVQVKHTGEAPISGASITDNLEAVLDDADYNDDVQASAGEAVVEGDTLTWNGDLAKGDVVDITYTVTTKDGGDDVLTNVVTSPDDRATCVAAPDENPDCTTEHFMGGYVFSKTSDPASGSAVNLGDTITYKVQVKHTGEAPISGASITDNLEAVLDDADYNDDVQASAGEAVVEGDTLTWNGDLAKGDVVDITYTVTTKDGGDDVLTNVVTSPDDRATCVAAPDENPDCTTEHFMGGYVFSKTSDPASGSAVKIGDTITYKVQVKHVGEAPISGASITDNLEAVLDDADYNDDVQASAGEAVVEGDTLTWNGDLAKGDVVDITYTVTTKDGGDDVLTNVVTSPDDRATCVAAPDENPDCTTEHGINEEPTPDPSEEPTPDPSEEPTPDPSEEPTPDPSEEPTPDPSEEPTPDPSQEPTPDPSQEPTPDPSQEPTPEPSETPKKDENLADTGAQGVLMVLAGGIVLLAVGTMVALANKRRRQQH